MRRLIFLFILSFSLFAFQQKSIAAPTSVQSSAAKTKSLEELRPTLQEILNVDPVKVPWGMNLDLVMKRGKAAREKSLDNVDFSSRVTLYQKQKSLVKKLAGDYADIAEKIKKVNAEAEQKMSSLGSANILKRLKMKNEIANNKKKALQDLQDQMTKLHDNLRDKNLILNKLAATVSQRTGLTLEQIAIIPDFDSWKALPKKDLQDELSNEINTLD